MNCYYVHSVLVLFLVTMEIGSAVKCGQNIDTDSGFRIVGGERAPKGKVPWQISLLVQGDNHCCGGSIIAPTLILTAAHCLWDVKSKGYNFYVVAGALIRQKGYKVGQLVKVKELIFHPKWNEKTAFADIMLLVLEKPLKYTPSGNGKDTTAVGPICLPDPNWSHKGKAKISGFGKTTHGGLAADTLLFIEEDILSDSICQRLYGRSNFPYDPKTMCCYGNMQGGKGTCQGDSGGPLVVRVGNKWVQKGIVSYGSICGGKNAPSVFTLVTAYLSWIKAEAKKRKIAL